MNLRQPTICALAAAVLSICAAATDDQSIVEQLVTQYEAKVNALRFENLAVELARMNQLDQLVRTAMFDILNNPDLTDEERALAQGEAGETILKVDAENTQRLKDILKNFSWQELAASRPDAAGNAQSIVQHSGDTALMQAALPHFEQFAREGIVGGGAFTNMYDRIAMRLGQPQRYGTQARCENGELIMHELEIPSGVDQRRSEFGLEPLADYQERLKEMCRNSC